MNEIGKMLKLKVRCVINPANRGPLLPMDGRYTTRDRKVAEQIAKEMLLRGEGAPNE